MSRPIRPILDLYPQRQSGLEGCQTAMSIDASPLTAQAGQRRWSGARAAAVLLALGMTFFILAAFVASVTTWTPAALAALPLVALTAVWISGGAATALLGYFVDTPQNNAPQNNAFGGAEVSGLWRPSSRTAILVTLCKEDPGPLALHLEALKAGLVRAGLRDATDIFVLSDTQGDELIAREDAAILPLQAAGILTYRRRFRNIGRKPGNIADWFERHGSEFDFMLVLDADSRMTPRRIRRMIAQMEGRQDLGLLQAGIALLPGQTRFGHHQRVAARLLSQGFGRGFAAWAGDSGNYWGHNAIIRIAAFRTASALPVLSGTAPWGGTILSHDFVEAAWIRRAGWAVMLDPDTAGSAEEAPQTVDAFNARDRRWCQGNLQHLRLLTEPGLDPVSRLHLAMGVLSYLVAPIWLLLVALVALGDVPVAGAVPLAIAAVVLLVPKLCALAEWWGKARTCRRRSVVLRASFSELVTSSIIAPLLMLRQAGAVMAVCLGRDCGWKSEKARRLVPRPGLVEAAVGWGFVGTAILVSGTASFWIVPVALPLCFAPAVMRIMNASA